MNESIRTILKEQEILNDNGKYATINKETGEIIHKLIKEKNPKVVLEIGTSIGYSGIWIASALISDSKLICIDRWKERAEIARNFFEKSKLNITLVEGNALEVIPKLNEVFDAIFLDATKSEYMKYLNLLIESNKLGKNALIIADNTLERKGIPDKTISHKERMAEFMAFAEKHNAKTLEIGSGLTYFTLD